jgi:plastocyanin
LNARRKQFPGALLLLASLFSPVASALAQTAVVTGQVQIAIRGRTRTSPRTSRTLAGVVVWLTAASALRPASAVTASPGHFRMAQKDKSFSPHLLVVPLGSSVEFPNLDPFFHNVFSLFNGKRFDLGLYEAGSTRTVRFDHEGVSYIFCNIHPEMSAVVIALSTPYVSVSAADGKLLLQGVPYGTYELHVWAEGADAQQLEDRARSLRIDGAHADLGILPIVKNLDDLTQHKNKFGEDYKPYGSPLDSYQ